MKKLKRGFSFILITLLSLSLFIGCGNNKSEKGGYVESNLNLPQGINGVSQLSVLENGDIALFGYVKNESDESQLVMYTSSDKCNTWTKKDIELPKSTECKKLQITNASIIQDGSVKVIAMGESAGDTEGSEEGQASLDNENMNNINSPIYEVIAYNIDSKGLLTEIPVEKNILGNNGTIDFDKDGNIYFYNNEKDTITKVDGNTGKVIIEFKCELDIVEDWAVSRNTLVALSSGEVVEYDLETGKQSNKVKLDKELLDNMGKIYPGSDDDSYFISSYVGVYQYEKSAKALKKTIDTSLISLGNSNIYIDDIIQLSDKEYMFTFKISEEAATLKLLKYDSEAKTKAENEITIYSLLESDELRASADRFKIDNPDINVNIVSGVTAEEYSKTAVEDAIKKLNTEIAAGKGPDIIMMDILPMDTFISKGILEDISDLVANNDELFPNIIKASTHTDGKIYTVPLKFTVPVIIAKDAGKINSLSTLAENIEAIASETDKSIIDVFTAEGLAYYFYRLSSDTWINTDNSINKEKLTEYLNNVKTIFNASKDKVSEQGKKNYEDSADFRNTLTQEEAWQYEGIGGDYLELLKAKRDKELVITNIISFEDLATINSIVKKLEGYTYELWKGQNSNTFIGGEYLSINSKSEKKDLAKKFIKYVFSKDEQKNILYSLHNGFPVNKATVEEYLNSEEAKYEYEQNINYNSDEVINYTVKSLSDEEMSMFMEKLRDLTSIINPDMEIINKIVTECGAFIRGEQSIDTTLKAIDDKLKIYLAE